MKTKQLADYIVEYIKADFQTIYLSGNLRDTITIEKTSNGYKIEIPAEMYDVQRFKNTGAIIYTGQGSYASEVDKTGGFSGKHTNYVDRAISLGLFKWGFKQGINYRLKDTGENDVK